MADSIAERLLDLRETYGGTLDETTGPTYRSVFDGQARKRFPRFVALLDDED